MSPGSVEFHSISELFPLMGGEEFEALGKDIARNGLRNPITLFEGKVLDGRNRIRACNKTGVQARFEEWSGSAQKALDFVISQNIYRRHLNGSQLAAVAVEAGELRERLWGEARKRYAQAEGKPRGVKKSSPKEPVPEEKGEARDQLGYIFGVSGRYIDMARKLKEEDPGKFEEVKAGKAYLSSVARKAEQGRWREEASKAAKLTGRFSVVYADPPWQYGASSVTGGADQHYATMPTREICRLPISGSTTDNAVLFLWCTNPLLPDGLEVIKEWGFDYKTCMVWVKDKATSGLGVYMRGQHELLLIATKGSMVPEKRPVSVITSARMEHSKKPDEVYGIIEGMYPNQRYAELFARQRHDGWRAFGNEI